MRITDYEKRANEYMKAQLEFYSKRKDVSRNALYSQIDFSLKGKKILDVGCGFGADLKFYKRKGAIVYGIDISRSMIEIAKKLHPDLKENLFVRSFDNTKFKSEFFDVIVSRYTLHYSKNLKLTFQELHRILKRGGILIGLVTHPFLILLHKKKNYHKKEIVNIPIYDGRFVTQQPSHTFSEYFNDFVLKHFKLLDFYEDKRARPEFFVFKLKRL